MVPTNARVEILCRPGAKTTWNFNAAEDHNKAMSRPHTASPAGSALLAPASNKDNLAVLMLGAIGVVFGDIGTSPLYAMKESFIGPHPLAVDSLHIPGVLSLIFWSLMLIVTCKYVLVAMRADNKGEGGIVRSARAHLQPYR